MLKKIIITVVSLIAIAIIVIAIVLGVVSKNIAGKKIKEEVPGLTYKKISGSIFSSLKFSDVKYAKNNWLFKAKSLTINMNFIDLARHHTINVNKLLLENGSLTKLKQSNTTTETKLEYKTQSKLSNKQNEAIQAAIKKIENSNNAITIDKVEAKNFAFNNGDKTIVRFKDITASATLHKNVNLKLTATTDLPFTSTSNLSINGSWEKYEINYKIQADNFNATITGLGSLNNLDTKISIDSKDNKATGNFKINFTNKLNWQLDLIAEQLRLPYKNIPTLYNLRLKADGSIHPDMWHANATVKVSHNNNTVSANITATHDKTTSIKVVATHKNDRAVINATYDNVWKFIWQINIAKLDEWFTDAKGSIISKGNASFHGYLPMTEGTISAKNLQYKKYHANNINGSWHINLISFSDNNLNLTADGLVTPFFQADTLAAKVTGNLLKQKLTLKLTKDQSTVNFATTTSRSSNSWQGTIDEWTITNPNQPDWVLKNPTDYTFSANSFAINNLCLQQQKTNLSICGDASIKDGIWQTDIKSSNIYLTNLLEWINPNYSWDGYGKINANISGDKQQIKQAQLALTTGPAKISINKSADFAIKSSSFNADFKEGDGLNATLKIIPVKYNPINATLALPNYSGLGLPSSDDEIKATATWQSPIEIFEYLFPKYVRPDGVLNVNATVTGTIAQPELNGTATLDNGSITIPTYGLTLKNVQASLNAKDNKSTLTATATSEGQELKINGELSIFPFKGNLKLTGNDAIIWNTPSYQIYATPDINLALDGKRVDLTGNVLIPHGSIRPPNFDSALTLPDDVTFTNEDDNNTTDKNSGWKAFMNVKLTIGNTNGGLTIDTMGLKGRLTGSLDATKKPNQPVLVTGQLRLANNPAPVFNFRGKTLQISSAVLSYNHLPISQPNVNVTAFTTIKNAVTTAGGRSSSTDLIVGVQLSGNIHNPTISFFSNPVSLSQNDILSYIIFGQPAATSGSAASLLITALQGSSSTGGLQGGLQKGLGLSELGVESQDTIDSLGNTIDHNNAVVIGKSLSRKLYLRYSIGIIDPVNTLEVIYKINNKWSLQTSRSSLGSGIDLIYSIERN